MEVGDDDRGEVLARQSDPAVGGAGRFPAVVLQVDLLLFLRTVLLGVEAAVGVLVLLQFLERRSDLRLESQRIGLVLERKRNGSVHGVRDVDVDAEQVVVLAERVGLRDGERVLGAFRHEVLGEDDLVVLHLALERRGDRVRRVVTRIHKERGAVAGVEQQLDRLTLLQVFLQLDGGDGGAGRIERDGEHVRLVRERSLACLGVIHGMERTLGFRVVGEIRGDIRRLAGAGGQFGRAFRDLLGRLLRHRLRRKERRLDGHADRNDDHGQHNGQNSVFFHIYS